ncbi:hypothetical protein N0V93_000814 [Gnomoniopsis smithogilvyi]|uniref:Uncharacterized protein n=1 Tax=Gnomoniopsis smithogilvyi TaxID=1191159 RepID=A0A9W8Z2P2_9PEZI|nr:hypothetical protein N0V93_000814 [Gnomoniopsis smithogilvyi]
MSPSCVLSSHLAKQFATSWREIRHPLEPGQTSPGAVYSTQHGPGYFQRASSPTGSDDGKHSMDSDRSSPSSTASMSRTTSNSSWKWGSR